jgi:hypothetical protein
MAPPAHDSKVAQDWCMATCQSSGPWRSGLPAAPTAIPWMTSSGACVRKMLTKLPATPPPHSLMAKITDAMANGHRGQGLQKNSSRVSRPWWMLAAILLNRLILHVPVNILWKFCLIYGKLIVLEHFYWKVVKVVRISCAPWTMVSFRWSHKQVVFTVAQEFLFYFISPESIKILVCSFLALLCSVNPAT